MDMVCLCACVWGGGGGGLEVIRSGNELEAIIAMLY